MTKKQFRSKVKELYRNNAKEVLDKKIDKILASGCIDWKNSEDNYILPRAFVRAFFLDSADQVCFGNYRKEAKNIEYFI